MAFEASYTKEIIDLLTGGNRENYVWFTHEGQCFLSERPAVIRELYQLTFESDRKARAYKLGIDRIVKAINDGFKVVEPNKH